MVSIIKNKNSTESLGIYVVTHMPECTWLNQSCYPLEIGAACRTNHCCSLRDDSGEDNISKKDRFYCELTGLYWIWKNNRHEYVGMYHYRRVFNITPEKIVSYLSKYDIILPKKIPIQPNLDGEYQRCKIPLDWEICKNVLHSMHPDYYNTLTSLLSEKKQYAYNMFVTRAEWLNEYSKWLFPLLFEIEKQLVDHNAQRLAYHEEKLVSGDVAYLKGSYERSIGYLAERLLHLFVIHNKLKIKEVNIYYPKPYNPITTKSPKLFRNIMGKNQFLIRLAIYMQDKYGWRLQKYLH